MRVSVGSTVEENVSLKLGQARGEEITVTGEGAVVDTQTNQISTNYDKDWVRNAPVPRFTFFDLINAAPGVNASATGSSRSTSLGSGTTDNAYMLDGTDFTAPLTGAAWPWPNTDAIEEIEVLSLGATAEYGNVLGAVFNVVTRQGSNAFHGDANVYFQNQGLTSRNTTDAQDEGLPYNRDKYNDAHRPAERPHPQGQALVLRLLPVPARLPVVRGHARPSSRRSSRPTASSASSTSRSTARTG